MDTIDNVTDIQDEMTEINVLLGRIKTIIKTFNIAYYESKGDVFFNRSDIENFVDFLSENFCELESKINFIKTQL